MPCPLPGSQSAASAFGQNGFADHSAPPATSYQGSVFTPQQNPVLNHSMPGQLPGMPALPNQPVSFQTQPFGSAPPSSYGEQAPIVANVVTPEPPKQKAPIPEEYVYLQTVLNELKTQCSNTATNPVNSHKPTHTHNIQI